MTPIANLNLALATTSPLILSTLFLSLTPTVFFQDPTETELQTAQRKVAELEAELGENHFDLIFSLDAVAKAHAKES
ncbi:MAG: hypothetical protein QF745_03550, partial [Planctomycetota bacterium]|nr:hypothetical protein [Planctomycetota bacterium]